MENYRISPDVKEETYSLLQKMAAEDKLNIAEELEMAIFGWYRFRHGFRGLKKDVQINDCSHNIDVEIFKMNKLIDDSIREQMEGMKDAGNLGR